MCVEGDGGCGREEGPGLLAAVIQGNTLYHTNLRLIASSSLNHAVNTQSQPGDNRSSEARTQTHSSSSSNSSTTNYV